MRIGIDATPITNRSGTGYYTQKLIEFLGRADSENEYVLFCPGGYQAHLEHHGIFDYPNFSFVELKGRRQIPLIIWKQLVLPGQARKLGIDLFHFPAFIASLRIDIPYVVTVHDLCFLLFPDAFSWPNRSYYNFIIPRSARLSSGIIADSKSTRNDVLSYLAPVRCRVRAIHLGVDPVRFYYVAAESAHSHMRQKYDLPEEFILYIGTLEPRKNIARLIKAYKQGVVDRGLHHHLVVAGRRGWLYSDIFHEVEALKLGERVHFPGHIAFEDLAALYSMAHALAYPSLYEGFGLPCLESMSCGTPVIASDRSSLPELVDDCALVVDPMSVDSIADALTTICNDSDRRQKLSEKGLKRARHFSWMTTARKTVEFYSRIFEETR
jgi:glycosyltransferase involved in cell wall biosynthesis